MLATPVDDTFVYCTLENNVAINVKPHPTPPPVRGEWVGQGGVIDTLLPARVGLLIGLDFHVQFVFFCLVGNIDGLLVGKK